MKHDPLNYWYQQLIKGADNLESATFAFWLRWLLAFTLIAVGCGFVRRQGNQSKLITGVICLASLLVSAGIPLERVRASSLVILWIVAFSGFFCLCGPPVLAPLIVNERWMQLAVTTVLYLAILISFIVNLL